MTKNGERTSSEQQGWLRWSLGTILMGILALNAGQARAQSMNLDIERRGHPTTVSTETQGVYLRYGVKATQDTSVFCTDRDPHTNLCRDEGLLASDDAHTVPYAVETEWTTTRLGNSGLPRRTVGGLNAATATTKSRTTTGTWRWDNKIEGPISATEDRPLLATMRLVKEGTEYNVSTNHTLKFAVNPQISIENDEATEGTDTHLRFKVTLLPEALETTTVNYFTNPVDATAGTDYTHVSTTLTWSVGQSIKYVEVPIIDDMVDDDGEQVLLTLTGAPGVTRFVDTEGYFQNEQYVPTVFNAAGISGIGTIRNDEPGPDPSVDDLPLVTIEAASAYVTEGSDAAFNLTRTGETTDALTVALSTAETGTMLAGAAPTSATFAEGDAETELRIATAGDETVEDDSTLTVTLTSDDAYRLGTNDQAAAAISVLDDDATALPGGTVAVEGTTIWTADMTVTDYGNGSVGAGTADLLANQRGSAGLQARSLYYHTEERKLRMAFTTAVDSGALTLAAGNVKLRFPEGTSGDSSFTWNEIDVDWTDGQTFEARLVSGEQEATEAPDPTLDALTVSDATLSPAFDAETLTYTATVGADTATVTVSGTPTDDDAAVAYTPSTDADSGQTGHQVAVAVGDTVATVTVTAADERTTRTYRVVVKRPAETDPEDTTETTPTVSVAGGSGTEGDEAISFSVTLDEAASRAVTVDYATSNGTATAGSDYTATSGTLSFSAGETRKTLAVTISDDTEIESDETFTVTLSNASGADLGTTSATGTIRNRTITPVTATFSNVPAEHGGERFTFDLAFSPEPKVSFSVLKSHAFNVDGGTVGRAQRKTRGSNSGWTISIDPRGSEAVSITLPATTDCDADGAVCTDEGGMLNHSTTDRVLGPVGISIGDAEVEEAAGAVIAFAVALSRAASSQVTVDYATSDGTATAGADYTSTSNTLTINAGSSSATIEVAVLDDEHNEGSEAFTLTLSNASSGNLTDSSATGTITNHDALPSALIARFGRTAAVHIVEQVEERVNAPRAPGFDGRVAGREINSDMGQQFALDFLQQLGGGYDQHQARRGGRMTAAGANDPRFGNGGMTSSLGPQGAIGGAMNPSASMQGLHPGQSYDQGMGMGLGNDRLLQGSSFALNRATSSGGVLSFWSRSAQSQFYGQDGALALNGDVRTSMFGADYAKGRMVTGVSLSHSRGLGRYAGVDSGQVNSAVTGLYPWIGYKASERVTVWTVAGYGAGGLMLNPGAGAPIETGLSMAMAAGGGRGQILGGGEGFGLAFKADTLWVGMRTKAASGPGGNLDSTTAAVSRLRTALEGSQSMTIASRMALTPSVEIGIRQDGGDAETGRGMDLGAGLVLADGGTGLAVDIRVRRLLVHQAEGFAESGMSISVSYNPTPSTPLGFTARVSPAWGGDAMSGAEALWGRESMGGMSHDPLMNGGGQRLDTEVGYGLPIGSRFVGTPRAGIRTSEYGRDYRIGYGMQVLEQGKLNLQLGVDAERRESPLFQMQEQNGGTDQRVLGRATVQW